MPSVANLPVRLPRRDGDENLSSDELATLKVFSRLKDESPSFPRFPGSCRLRRFRRGEVVCTQGEAGSTAYSIISSDDILGLRRLQLPAIDEALAVLKTGGKPADKKYRSWSESALQAERIRIDAEKERLESGAAPQTDVVVRAYVAAAGRERRRPGWRRWIRRWFTTPVTANDRSSIVNEDLPIDVDRQTMQGDLFEGDLFGEMSCTGRLPRSATCVALRDCYILEINRNILDQMRKNREFQQELDSKFRERVMQTQVRQLPVFRELSDASYASLAKSIELVDVDAGQVVFEEHETSDSFYLVRNGWIKVARNAWTHLTPEEGHVCDWARLQAEIGDPQSGPALKGHVLASLPDSLKAVPSGDDVHLDADSRRNEWNAWIRSSRLRDALKKAGLSKTAPVAQLLGPERATIGFDRFPEKCEEWTDQQNRQFNRLALELSAPGIVPRRIERGGVPHILKYIGRGQFFGELGLVRGAHLAATCVALAQPDLGQSKAGRGGIVGSRVELVKISETAFRKLLADDPQFRARIEEQVKAIDVSEARSIAIRDSGEDEFGLAQGLNLMVIDLDRCTRCSACVEACIETHTDGWNRLYLDGPRFGRFLLPMTCRQCRDPVCMIGCPVGAINKGDRGEIQITDWCIGCTLCADQCPYGAIQMNELSSKPKLTDELTALIEGSELKPVSSRAVVCDQCRSLSPSLGPACVTACPHDAAIRLDGVPFARDPSLAALPPSLAGSAARRWNG
jgi:Fe-S-cluster-containing dehydrogenase component/CRP-like cAMP-binding protein